MFTRIRRQSALLAILAAVSIAGYGCYGSKGSGMDSGRLAMIAAAAGVPQAATGPATGGSSPAMNASTSQFISSASGGTVSLGTEVTLVIPPGSMDADHTITIRRASSVPSAYAYDNQYDGQGYELEPSGTLFDPANPATMYVTYNGPQIAAQGYTTQEMQMLYFDPSTNAYVGTGSFVDPNAGQVVASIEHFTSYMVGAVTAGAVSSNSAAPLVTPQTVQPAPARAGAPLQLRASATDLNGVAGVHVFYRTRQGAPAFAFASDPALKNAWMKKQVMATAATQSFWYYNVPASATSAAAGWSIDYCFVAYDNLGDPSVVGGTAGACAVTSLALGRWVDPTYALRLNPVTSNLTAGDTYLASIQARDNLGTLFSIYLDDTAATPSVTFNWTTAGVPALGTFASAGSASPEIFTAATDLSLGGTVDPVQTLTNTLQISMTNVTATPVNSIVSVAPGQIGSLDVLVNGTVVSGVHQVKEGTSIQFDVRGKDAFGNKIAVVPQQLASGGGWSVAGDSSAGAPAATYAGSVTNYNGCPPACPVVMPGLWDNFDVFGYVKVAVDFVGKQANVIYQVLARTFSTPTGMNFWESWNPSLGIVHAGQQAHNPSVATAGGVLYYTYAREFAPCLESPSGCTSSPYYAPSPGNYGYELRDRYYDPATSNVGDPGIASGINGALNSSPYGVNARLISNGTYVFAAVNENSAAYQQAATNINRVSIKKLDPVAAQWQNIPGCSGALNVNSAHDAYLPSIALVGPDVYVAWEEDNGAGAYQIVVARCQAGTISYLATSLNAAATNDARRATIVNSNGNILVLWRELIAGNWDLQKRVFDVGASTWVQAGSQRQSGSGTNVGDPNAVSFGGYVYVTWREYDSTTQKVFAMRESYNSVGQLDTWGPVVPAPAAPIQVNSNTTFSSSLAGYGEPIIAVNPSGIPYVMISEGSGIPFTSVVHYNGSWKSDGQACVAGEREYTSAMIFLGSDLYTICSSTTPGTNEAISIHRLK